MIETGVSDKSVINSLYELEKKECSEYTKEDNLFIFRTIHCEDEYIKKVALNTVTMSIIPYIRKRATKLVNERGNVGNLSSQSIDDIFAAGLTAFAQKILTYSPEYNTQISTYVTYWTEQAMEAEIDKEIKGYELPDYSRRAMKFIAMTTPLLNERGIKEPTAQDYYHLAAMQGKDITKYNITLFERTLELMKCSEQHSMEELENIGVQIYSGQDVYEEVVNKNDYDAVVCAINKLAYFDKIAIECKIEAGEICENNKSRTVDNRTIYNTAYRLFKEKTNIKKFSQRDYTRLVTDATNELRKRLEIRSRKKKNLRIVDNSLAVDDSFDLYFDDTAEYMNVDKRHSIDSAVLTVNYGEMCTAG